MTLYVLGYIIAAVLPIIGFGRLLWRAQRELSAIRERVAERGHAEMTWDDFDEDNGGSILAEPTRARANVVWDISLVGVGLVVGAATSIAALPWGA